MEDNNVSIKLAQFADTLVVKSCQTLIFASTLDIVPHQSLNEVIIHFRGMKHVWHRRSYC